MIVITGSAGFIGSCLVSRFNNEGLNELILVDDFSKAEKESNYNLKTFYQKIERKHFINWFENHANIVKQVIHIGARTDTTEFNVELLTELNLNYSKSLWNICSKFNIPLIYASSAATYGLGEFGYDDDETKLNLLKPLNPYGDSKNEFDKWAIFQKNAPPNWQGLKFFNVYGPNEYHKGRMASVIMHAFYTMQETGKVKLFKSHNPKYKDGEQLRDFIYVKDVVDVIWFLCNNHPKNGIYNLGSGKARTFLDLVNATFSAAQLPPYIEFIDTPVDIRDKYQYYTQANMQKLIQAGYKKTFTTLEEGVKDYVCNYLMYKNYF
ncbi:MAG: ADP-glyceromanno-heptose 6-epimerase [Bacteroidota bacterium]|nr:ADP-glyceromanno-heptose 6-epimerase [Bacteroidota bacterium]